MLDEPTASLPAAEVRAAVHTCSTACARPAAAWSTSATAWTRVFRIADRVTVMRDGRRVATRAVADTTPAELVELIVGRTPQLGPARRQPVAAIQPLLAGTDIVTEDAGPIDFALRPGEIVGLRRLARRRAGTAGPRHLRHPAPRGRHAAGSRGQPIDPRTPAQAVRLGIAFVSSKRQEESLAMPLAVRENLFVNPAVEGRGLFSPITETTEAGLALARLRTVGARPLLTEPAIATFSGGNQQKVVLSRWLGGGIAVLVLEEPTMGVDVGAKADIYALLDRHAAGGGGVIVVSTDFEEVAAICHRALIFDRGRVSGELAGEALTPAGLIGACGGNIPAASH